VALFTYPLAATLVVMAQPLLAVWVGVQFGETSADLLRVLAVAYAVMALTAIPSTAADALNRPGISVRYSLTGFLIHLAIALPLIPRMGLMGAGLATLGNVVLQSPFFIRAVTRGIVRVPLGAYLRRVVGEPLAPAVLVAAVLGATLAAGIAGRADGLALSLLLAAAAFAVSLRAFGVLDSEEKAFVKGLPGGRVLAWVVGR
jgi:O-antigen/teichoic acid export membrane protein